MYKQSDDNDIVLNLLLGSVPERTKEIRELWKTYNPKIEVIDSKVNDCIMNANNKRIQFDTKILDIFWMLGFSAWRSIETYSPVVILSIKNSISIDNAIKLDKSLQGFELNYKERMSAVQSNIKSARTNFDKWPSDIPTPRYDRNQLQTLEDQVAFDLVCLALAFAFFHEFHHLKLITDKTQPDKLPEEEIACDVWARAFITEKLAEYAKKNGHSYSDVLLKRSMGMSLGAIIVHALTPQHAYFGTSDYPPIKSRIKAIILSTSIPDCSYLWLFNACLLVGIMRISHRPIKIIPSNYRQLCENLISELE